MFKRPWDIFFEERIGRILCEKSAILDIGGGLRLDAKHSNRANSRNRWIAEEIRTRDIAYTVLDYVGTYNPDIIGDIQNLPLVDASQEAIICNAVLEHVENPLQAAREIYRTLKSGGYCFVYVPFLYYYHAERNYYKDYWRFTEDSLRSIFSKFSVIEIQNVRGPFESLVRLSPFGRGTFFQDCAYLIDRMSGKLNSKQTSGYMVFLQK